MLFTICWLQERGRGIYGREEPPLRRDDPYARYPYRDPYLDRRDPYWDRRDPYARSDPYRDPYDPYARRPYDDPYRFDNWMVLKMHSQPSWYRDYFFSNPFDYKVA
jgi:hypothetical protein